MNNETEHNNLLSNQCEYQANSFALIKGGNFEMGSQGVYKDESPTVKTTVNNFMMKRFEVTNKEFAEFIEATGYKTIAERQPDPSMYPDIDPALLRPGSAVFVGLSDALRSGQITNWWVFTDGANWRHPSGPNSNIEGLDNHPVVHIALDDAEAYAAYKGERLPSETEFEYAARSGLINKKYARGNTLKVDGKHQANTWQGVFPFNNNAADGHTGTAPVGCYTPNNYGLHDMIGNVWEWTSTTYYPQHIDSFNIPKDLPKRGFDPNQPGIQVGVIKGGSYLCAETFCARYRPAARHAQDISFGTSHIGFRTVKDI